MIKFAIRKAVANLWFGWKHNMCQAIQISPRKFNACISKHDLKITTNQNSQITIEFFFLYI